MKTIETRYIGPTNTKPARIVATDCGDHRVTVTRDHDSDTGSHDAAMRLLCAKLGWSGSFVRGATKAGYVYVFADDTRVVVEKLTCDMKAGCMEPISHIDRKGYIYCKAHGIERRPTQPCRALTMAELATILSGDALVEY